MYSDWYDANIEELRSVLLPCVTCTVHIPGGSCCGDGVAWVAQDPSSYQVEDGVDEAAAHRG